MTKQEFVVQKTVENSATDPSRQDHWIQAAVALGLFDESFYLQSNPDVAQAGMAPLLHFLNWGWKEGRSPSRHFHPAFYLERYPDVAASGMNPLEHYVLYGQHEQRLCSPDSEMLGTAAEWRALCDEGLLDPVYYVLHYPDVTRAGLDPLEHFMRQGWREGRNPSDAFDTNFYKAEQPQVDGQNPLLHYWRQGRALGYAPLPADTGVPPSRRRGSAEFAQDLQEVRASGEFDEVYYLANNPELAQTSLDPLEHYLLYGWAQLRNPSRDLDVVWYTQTHLRGRFDQDPLLHYVRKGKDRGLASRPAAEPVFKPSPVYTRKNASVRRICLFAGYDPDGIVDDCVLHYLKDLARHADIYYLADCEMRSGELRKLDGLVKEAWSIRHGAYDFGSWSKLARDLVGWDRIETYDELIFANDSCYRVRSFREVFSEMHGRDCAWWGLQATKGIAATFAQQALPHTTTLAEIKTSWLGSFERDYVYDFLVGSYFLVFRKDVLSDRRFQGVINAVARERSKLAVIRKYEIGITRWLIAAGYNFDTLIPEVYPWQPIFSDTAFDLVSRGFPLFKRYLLTDNHYKTAGLRYWKQKLQAAGCAEDFSIYERNLFRVADEETLFANLGGTPLQEEGLLSDQEMAEQDLLTPKYDNWWAFPACAFNHLFSDNIRALFEHVKDDPSIKKIVLTRSRHVRVSGRNVVVVPLKSRQGQYYLLRARQIFLKHTIKSNVAYPLDSSVHNFHALWHGIPLKKIGYTSLDQMSKLSAVEKGNRALRSVISASPVDRLAMSASFWPLTYHDVWMTGLPRHDFILCKERELPDDLSEEYQRLDRELAGRKLVLFAPTFRRDQQDGYYSFSPKEIKQLVAVLERHNCVMGVREHMADRKRLYNSQLVGERFIDLSEKFYPDIEMLYRRASALITDFSSSFIDFLLTGNPVISFAYDFDSYTSSERGLFYDMEWAFPGPIAKSVPELLQSLQAAFQRKSAADKALYDYKSRLFLGFKDCDNSRRVCEKVLETYSGSKTAFELQGIEVLPLDPRRILWICPERVDLSLRNRVTALATGLAAQGWRISLRRVDELVAEDFCAAATVILSGVAPSDSLADYCTGIRQLGARVWVDVPQAWLSYCVPVRASGRRAEGQLERRDLDDRLQRAVDLADGLLLSQGGEGLAPLLPEMPLLRIPDPFSPQSPKAPVSRPAAKGRKPRAARIVYCGLASLPDGETHPAWRALRELAATRPGLEVHLFSETVPAPQVVFSGLAVHPPAALDFGFLSEADLCISVPEAAFAAGAGLDRDALLAACCSVPTLADAAMRHAGTLRPGLSVLLCEATDWLAAITRLLDKDAERTKIGRMAAEAYAKANHPEKAVVLLAKTLAK